MNHVTLIGSLRGWISGLAFLAVRVPVYAGAILLAVAASAVGLVLFAIQGLAKHVAETSQGPGLRADTMITSGSVGERHA